ncbi:MAG: hypothetical protein QM704_06845 [Anaeromyxobacteraceae bacterium]
MTLRTHELHPAIVHAPLALLPFAAGVEVLAAVRPRDRRLDRFGRRLWWTTAGSALLVGLTGMAASQEIELESPQARDKLFLHGIGNFGLVAAAFGVAAWRSAHRASATSAASAIVATAASVYTAYLGGDIVYAHGAGVKVLGGPPAQNPGLFSREAPGRLARDAGRGLAWLLRRAGRAITGKERVDRAALGPIAEVGTGAEAPAPFVH